jgi:hypothetical protein
VTIGARLHRLESQLGQLDGRVAEAVRLLGLVAGRRDRAPQD